MEAEDSSPASATDISEISEGPKTVDLQATFVTLQTKEGQSSQKIPLFTFLEQMMGSKLDTKVTAENISLLLNGKPQLSAAGETSQKDTGQHLTEDGDGNKERVENKQVPKEENLPPKVVPQKPKGRGRPRKIKVEVSKEKAAGELGSSQSDSQHKTNGDNVSKDSPNTVHSLRRSSRIPAKNSRFKDDYVDSSLLASKSVSSGDTRLMTLALAAECHTTKPNNKQTSSLRKEHASPNQTSSGTSQQPSTKLSAAEEGEGNESPSIEDDRISIKKDSEKDIELNNPIVEKVIKRSLHTQLTLSIASTTGKLSSEPNKVNDGSSHSSHYFVIKEPKTAPAGNALLVHNAQDRIQFNIADISGSDDTCKLPNPAPCENPLDRYFTCDSCDKIFPAILQWQLHQKHFHSRPPASPNHPHGLEKNEVYSCQLCGQKFPFQFMLDKHLQKQNCCNKFVCLLCSRVFSTKEEQEEHHTMAHPNKLCVTCGKSFDNDNILRKHFKDCTGTIAACHLSQSDNEKMDSKEFLDDLVLKNENPLTSQEEDVLRQRDPSERLEPMKTDDDVHHVTAAKIQCELCGVKFSTFSGLWHHKLEIHNEFFPLGYKGRLKSKLQKNQQVLASLPDAQTSSSGIKDKGKNCYFVTLKPKWFSSKPQLKVSLENKTFNFIPVEPKLNNSTSEERLASGQPISLADKISLFECMSCSQLFQSASGYREHRSKVHNECFETVRYFGAFQCSHCSNTFPCEFMLDQHIKQHTKRKLLPCTLCGLSFNKIQERRQHWKQAHPGVGCPNCGKMYASIQYLQKHISLNCQDHYPPSKKFIAFRQKQHNDFHMEEKDKRVEKRIIKCHLCPKICSSIHGWRRHMSENHQDQGFSKLSNTCIVCNQVIYGYKALEKHLLEVHAEESGLPIEEENSIIKEALKKSKLDIQDYMKAGKSCPDIYQDEEGNFHCPQCPKTHADLKALTIHIKTHINMQLECSVCHKSFKNPTLLRQHVMRHRTTAVYNCHTCNKKFMTLQKLNKHNKVHHSKENFVCELCGMSFALNDYLLKHKRCHSDIRPHLCSVCGKTFRTKPELRVHVLIHTQETPYVCEHCGRGFTQKGNWRIHLAQHTGVKPHKCDLCDLSFALPSHLKRHLQTHNQKINYRCIWCDKECTQRKHMQMHVTRVHKEDFFQYEEQMKLESPIPIAPSQLKIYNRRLGKSNQQVRKAYKTQAKKCNSSIQDIMDGIPRLESADNEQEVAMSDGVMGSSQESVGSSLSLGSQDLVLVRGDHQSYVKHDISAGLIEEDGSNVEIVMGENNEINIIINNADPSGIPADLSLQDGLDVSLSQLADGSVQLPSSLQQAVNALVADHKEESVEVADSELPLAMEAMMTEDSGENFSIVYPSAT